MQAILYNAGYQKTYPLLQVDLGSMTYKVHRTTHFTNCVYTRCSQHIYIYIIARVEGQYKRIFGSRLAVLAQPLGGPIKMTRTEYSPVLPDLTRVIIYFLYDLALASSINGLDSSLGRKRWYQSYVKPSKKEGYSFAE